MEKKQKDLISILLLIVGVVFILVAGGIFVTTAWRYLPVFVKQMALLVVAFGMFGASYGLSKNEKLSWISETLFHLGNVFVGFFVIVILGGMVRNNLTGNAFKMLAASGAMAIPVGIKMIVKRSTFDFVALTLLVDSMLLSGCVAMESTFTVYLCWLAGFTVGLTVLDCMIQTKKTSSDCFTLCVGIVNLIHAVIYALLSAVHTLLYSWGSAVAILLPAVTVLITGISWMVRKNVALRIWNSFAAMYLVFVTVFTISGVFDWNHTTGMDLVIGTFFVSILMVVLRRKEIIGTIITVGIIIPYGQLFFYWVDALIGLFEGMDSSWSTTYNAYSFIVGTAMFALYIVMYGCEDIFKEWKESKLLKFAGLQMITGCVVWIASKMVSSWGMVFFLLVAVDMLLVVSVLKNETAKKVFKTFAMFAFVFATASQPFVEIPKVFFVEWVCFLVAIGIVLFRHIWYDKKDQFSIIYFVVTCVILVVLLLSNLNSGGIGNVLILGMTGIVMLVSAAMQNNKKYVIASSTTLILLVLYLTREFWLSIAWWVYLFVAGVVLVLLAVKKAKEA